MGNHNIALHQQERHVTTERGVKNNIKFYLYPSFVQDALDSKLLIAADLTDPEILTTIFSEQSVSKIRLLNNEDLYHCNKTSEQFNLNYFFKYARTNNFLNTEELKVKRLSANATMDALTRFGDEAAIEPFTKLMYNYYLPFKAIRINNNTYAVVFQNFEEVDCPIQRHKLFIHDMGELLRKFTFELSDEELKQERFYLDYVNLIAS